MNRALIPLLAIVAAIVPSFDALATIHRGDGKLQAYPFSPGVQVQVKFMSHPMTMSGTVGKCGVLAINEESLDKKVYGHAGFDNAIKVGSTTYQLSSIGSIANKHSCKPPAGSTTPALSGSPSGTNAWRYGNKIYIKGQTTGNKVTISLVGAYKFSLKTANKCGIVSVSGSSAKPLTGNIVINGVSTIVSSPPSGVSKKCSDPEFK